jgi:hypothetical protein
LNFKASAAETGIYHGLKIAFLESTVHKLSTNDLLVYQKTVHDADLMAGSSQFFFIVPIMHHTTV